MKTSRILLCICLTSGISGVTSASSLETIGNLSQDQFAEFSKELGAATHYKSVSPPESMGTLGFDVGLELSSTDVSGDVFDLASDGSFEGSDLVVPKLHVHKGLPFGLDIGASLGAIPDTDATIIGGELRYAIINGGVVTPSIAIRASYSQIQGLDDIDVQNSAIELGISKGVLFFTPYAGIGIVQSKVTPNNIDGLSTEKIDQDKMFVGITANFGVAVTLEADLTGDVRTYSAKAGIRF